jgi:hypothetical protein
MHTKYSLKETLEIKTERFFICPIHLEPLEDPVQGPCGHIFCRNCINTCLEKNRLCPICQTNMDKHELYPSLIVKQIIEEHIATQKNEKKRERRDFLKPIRTFINYQTQRFWRNRWDLKIIICFLLILSFYLLLKETNQDNNSNYFYYSSSEVTLWSSLLLIVLNYIIKH